MHLTRFDWFKNNQLLSELTHAHYREPVSTSLKQVNGFLSTVQEYPTEPLDKIPALQAEFEQAGKKSIG